MFKGLKISQFLNDYKEWHALVEGFCDGFWPFSKGSMSKKLKEDIEGEHHYYRAGVCRRFGAIAAPRPRSNGTVTGWRRESVHGPTGYARRRPVVSGSAPQRTILDGLRYQFFGGLLYAHDNGTHCSACYRHRH